MLSSSVSFSLTTPLNLWEFTDSDGDFDIIRSADLRINSTESSDAVRHAEICLVLHETCTDLESVGLQLWSGAFLLSDYLIHVSRQLEESSNWDFSSRHERGTSTVSTSPPVCLFACLLVCVPACLCVCVCVYVCVCVSVSEADSLLQLFGGIVKLWLSNLVLALG